MNNHISNFPKHPQIITLQLRLIFCNFQKHVVFFNNDSDLYLFKFIKARNEATFVVNFVSVTNTKKMGNPYDRRCIQRYRGQCILYCT